MKKLKRILIGLGVILLVGAIVVMIVLKHGITVVISEAEIRESAAKMFPLTKTHLLVLKVTYSDPVIELLDHSDRIRFGMTVTPEVRISGKTYSGNAVVNGGFRYVPDKGEFYLTGFTIERIDIKDSGGLDLERISSGLSDALESVYSKRPIYRLEEGDLKQKTAKMVVRSISVRGREVVIVFGL